MVLSFLVQPIYTLERPTISAGPCPWRWNCRRGLFLCISSFHERSTFLSYALEIQILRWSFADGLWPSLFRLGPNGGYVVVSRLIQICGDFRLIAKVSQILWIILLVEKSRIQKLSFFLIFGKRFQQLTTHCNWIAVIGSTFKLWYMVRCINSTIFPSQLSY